MSNVMDKHNFYIGHQLINLTSAIVIIAIQAVANRACAVVAAYFIGTVVLTSTIVSQALIDV